MRINSLSIRDGTSGAIDVVAHERILLRAKELVVANCCIQVVASDVDLGSLDRLGARGRGCAWSKDGQGLRSGQGEAATA